MLMIEYLGIIVAGLSVVLVVCWLIRNGQSPVYENESNSAPDTPDSIHDTLDLGE